MQRNGQGEAQHALRELVRRYGTKVLGDPKIGQLARANSALAPYGAMLEAFARAGLYATYLDHVEQGREKDAAIRAAADRLAPVGTPQRAAAEWVCRVSWRLVESLAQRPPMLEFAKLVLHQAWYPAGIACLMLWGGYLTVFAPLAAHQGQGLIRQMLGGAVALVVLAMLSLFGVSALYAIAFLW